MRRISVSQLGLDMTVTKQRYLLREKNVTATRNGGSLLRVILADSTGTISAVLFDAPGHVSESLAVGQGVEVTGRVTEHREQLQITLERITPATLTNLSDYLPAAHRPMAEMIEEFDGLLASVTNPSLSRLLSAVFGDTATYNAFTQAPAAKTYHHACIGGLLEHTLSVARLVLAACTIYSELDRDLALTVTLLHDLGKLHAYDPISFELTSEGLLWGHLYGGSAQVQTAIDSIRDFDPELRLRVVHALLAHHGKLENGSPVVPMTLEAIVLHYADNLDGDARGALDQYGRSEGDGKAFTDRSQMHDTRLYRGESSS
ncbi:MAG: 3'-5' exoribonuclease YhaM family protein [Anaerolineae bacterium]